MTGAQIEKRCSVKCHQPVGLQPSESVGNNRVPSPLLLLAVDGSWPFSLAAVYKLLPQHITTRSGFLLSSILSSRMSVVRFSKLPSFIHPHTHLQRNKMRANTAQHQTATHTLNLAFFPILYIYFWDPPILSNPFSIFCIDLFSLSRVK